MTAEVFDAVIVGAGQAGPAIAARCSREGLKTAVIERHHFGAHRELIAVAQRKRREVGVVDLHQGEVGVAVEGLNR